MRKSTGWNLLGINKKKPYTLVEKMNTAGVPAARTCLHSSSCERQA